MFQVAILKPAFNFQFNIITEMSQELRRSSMWTAIDGCRECQQKATLHGILKAFVMLL